MVEVNMNSSRPSRDLKARAACSSVVLRRPPYFADMQQTERPRLETRIVLDDVLNCVRLIHISLICVDLGVPTKVAYIDAGPGRRCIDLAAVRVVIDRLGGGVDDCIRQSYVTLRAIH